MASYLVRNFGCRTSQAEGAQLAAGLDAAGFQSAGEHGHPDLIVINTCTVTSAADAEARQEVRRLHRLHPAARIVVTGCYAQRAPEEVAALPGVSLVAGNAAKAALPEQLAALEFHGGIAVPPLPDRFGPVLEAWTPDRARPNIKIQDGCNARCSYCIIPSVRGNSRSALPEHVIERVRAVARDHAEVVLTGINMGRWGRDLAPGIRLVYLLERLLSETSIARIRLSSVEPMDWSDTLIDLIASTERICRHIHAPLQSGSASVLRRMRRRYRPEHYAARILRAADALPNAAIGADVLTGFPGETDSEFEQTVAFLEQLPLTYLHVFTYSERPGTHAANASDAVPVPVRRERTERLREVSSRKQQGFRSRQVGRTLSAVVLRDGRSAITTNYQTVTLGTLRAPAQLIDVEIGAATSFGLLERGAVVPLPPVL